MGLYVKSKQLLIEKLYLFNNTLKKLYGPFLWMGFNCPEATEPPRGGSLLFITKSQRIPGTHLILSVNSVYMFSKMYLSYRLNFNTNSKMTLVEFQYEPVTLDIKEVCFEEEQDIPDRLEK